MDKIRFTEGAAFFVFEVIFCVSFVALCEIPNWALGPRKVDACDSRWMFTTGVFFPSAISKTLSTSTRTSRSKPE